ncbi:OadG family protein [Marinomonas algarum]|uniref:Probable oxaloacetate decarboxylase gamma chain n=1 Tax=Marinomonas algarum TaxID=2883105 RepID=A0A9X1LFM6_9GAMM|nr:OadG family transporter subunit [Marinomonas algarum]MCB5163047.1 OadG family protein [Marinomonas algarum]
MSAMNGLLEDGLGLMVLGMGFVFLFLVVLIFATGYMSRLLNHFFPDVPVGPKKSPTAPAVSDSLAVTPQMAAVITAAVHQHRNKNS